MAASLLTEGTTVLRGVPRLKDVATMSAILRALGTELEWSGAGVLHLRSSGAKGTVAPYELVRQMRASICLLGPLLARRGAAAMPLPGGCVIGDRPINLHLKGLRALGATIEEDEHQLYGQAGALRGSRIDLAGPHGSTVLGTANVMMAAALAEGATVIEHAAREPEVQDLARFLRACGADVTGIGTGTLTITGTRRLQGTEYSLIPDRIEAATFLAAGAITGGDVTIEGVRPDHMESTIRAMERMGVALTVRERSVRATTSDRLGAAELVTAPYPGLPTDVQPQLSALLSLADGVSTVREIVYPDRFTHVPALRRLGASIVRKGAQAAIQGVDHLEGGPVAAADLRAGAALVLAGLAAEGVTRVSGVDQIDRGYDALEQRLGELGADISRRNVEWTLRREPDDWQDGERKPA
jgi:UDP-N-acetylglucosamine 1-carboxyvinyltransferase